MNLVVKLFKLISIFIIVFLIVLVIEYARQGYYEDLSMQKTQYSSIPSSVYLVSYADGPEYFYRNQNAMTHYAINKNIDFFHNYNKKHIDKSYLDTHEKTFKVKIGGGMWLWKPYIIMEALNHAPEDSIIIYLDAAFKIKKPLENFLKLLDHNDIILTHDHERLNGSYIKGDSFKLMECDNEQSRNSPHIMSGALFIKNTEYSREFIKKWLKAMEDYRILSNEEFGIKSNYPEYKWHHFDQSVLSLIYFKNSKKVKMIEFSELSKYFSLFHRKPSKSSPNKDYYTIYGIDPIINNNKYGKNLPSTSLLNFPPVVSLRKILSK